MLVRPFNAGLDTAQAVLNQATAPEFNVEVRRGWGRGGRPVTWGGVVEWRGVVQPAASLCLPDGLRMLLPSDE